MTKNQTVADTLAAEISLLDKQAGETDFNVCRRHVSDRFDQAEINELCQLLEISTKQPKHRKVAKLIEAAFQFDTDGNILSTSTVVCNR